MIRNRLGFAAILWSVAFALYALTAPPSISEIFSDSLEFQLVVPSFGITHPTGYPLYTLLGGLWSRFLFPFANWAWRMNLFSALAAATALALLTLLAQQLTSSTNRQLTIPWAALAFALIPTWWQQATIAEVYALHLCFVGAILLVAVGDGGMGGWRDEEKGRKGEREQGESQSFDCAQDKLATRNSQFAIRNSQFLLIGLALAHHRTAVLLLPGLALYWLWTQPAIFRPQRAWIQWAMALLAPLLLYAYLPIRAAQGVQDLHGDYTNTPAGFLRYVLALGYTNFFAANELSHSRTLLDWIALFRQQMGSGVLLVAMVGAILLFNPWQAKRAAAGWILVTLVLVTNLIFAVNYQVSDVEVFLLPVFFCIALFFEAGVNGALAWLDKALGNAKSVQWLLAILLLALLVGSADWQSAWQRANDWSIHDNAVTMATTAFPPNSRVIGLEGEMTALRYMQQSEALGLNAQPINADTAEVRRSAIAESVAQGYPTYITRELPGIETSYDFSGEGVLVRVWRKGSAQLEPLAQSVTIDVAKERLRLIGYDLHRLDQAGGTAWQLSLDWQAERPIEESLKFSLRWLAVDGSPLLLPDGAQGQDEFPLRQVIPTQYWQVGKTMRDVQIVRLPAQLRQSAHTLLLIVYDSATGVELGRWQVDLPG